MKRALAALVLFVALAPVIAAEPALKPPPAAIQPAPTQPQPQAAEPAFYLMPAHAVARIADVIETMQREIERLQAIVEKGNCS